MSIRPCQSDRPGCWVAIAMCWAAMACGQAATAPAAEFRTGQRVEIEAGEVIDDDLYVVADVLIVRGVIKGDLFASCTRIGIEGHVGGSAGLVAQSVDVSGAVVRTLRVACITIELDAAVVGGDGIFLCERLIARDGTHVQRDLLSWCIECDWRGVVDRNLFCAANRCLLGGVIGGSAQIEIRRSSGLVPDWSPIGNQSDSVGLGHPLGLIGHESLAVMGDLRYQAPRRAEIHEDARVSGSIDFVRVGDQPWDAAPRWSPRWWLGRFRQGVVLLVAGGIFAFLFPRMSRRVTSNIKRRPIASALLGLPGIAGAVLVIALVFGLTLTGALLCQAIGFTELTPLVVGTGTCGVLTLAVGLLLFVRYIAIALFAMMTGQVLLGRLAVDYAQARFLPLLVGVFLISFLMIVPRAEWVVFSLAILLASGAMAVFAFSRDEPPSPPRE